MNLDIKGIIIKLLHKYLNYDKVVKTKISRVLDICQNLKAIAVILNSEDIYFVLHIIGEARNRNFIQLETWVAEKCIQYKVY